MTVREAIIAIEKANYRVQLRAFESMEKLDLTIEGEGQTPGKWRGFGAGSTDAREYFANDTDMIEFLEVGLRALREQEAKES